MFKFYTKGGESHLEGAVFYNGQRVLEVWINKHNDEIIVEVTDGSGTTMAGWVDFEEADD